MDCHSHAVIYRLFSDIQIPNRSIQGHIELDNPIDHPDFILVYRFIMDG